MRKIILLLPFLLLSVTLLFAQPPVNDDCGGIIDLGLAPTCNETDPIEFYNNIEATETTISTDPAENIPACFNGGFIGRDVWFVFTASDTISDYRICLAGLPDDMGNDAILNPQIAVYRGDCSLDNVALFACISADDGTNTLEFDIFDLDPGAPYYLRINDYSSTATPNWGAFTLCVKEKPPVDVIDGGMSNACTGTLVDSGGEDGDYGPNESNTFTICPEAIQVSGGCIDFALQYYNIEAGFFGGGGDVINFYDGPDNSGGLISSLDGSDGGDGPNNGGVCYTVQASSGCLTIEFITNGTVEFEGFLGTWECSSEACEPNVAITVTEGASETDIIDFVATPQTTVTVDTIICPDFAYGTFLAGDDTDLGLEKGLLLTSGNANGAIGPASNFSSGNLGTGGDADLDYLSSLSGGQSSNDVCIIELDVFVATDELTFEYIFGSEEYPEFVNSFNDIFALLVSGPNIQGDPNMNNQMNIAIIPGTSDPVEINAVNDAVNWEYYRNNLDGQSVGYDGLTSDYLGYKKSLTASTPVTPCNTYHLKFAIADRGDTAYDSGVFISEIKGGTPNLEVNFASGVDYLIEDCTGVDDELNIFLSNALEDSVTYTIVVEGTATQGVDYILDIPNTITFAPGETNVSFPFIPIADGLEEGVETIRISLVNNFGCGDIVYTVIEIELHDEPEVLIFSDQDTAFVCQDGFIQMEVSGAVDYSWTPISVFDDDQIPNPIATPTESQWVYVTGFVGICSDNDSTYLQIIDPQMALETPDPTGICQGTSVALMANNNVNDSNISWEPETGLDDPTISNPIATPMIPTTYTATVTLAGCEASDEIFIDVDEFDYPIITTLDTTLCQGSPLMLASTINNTTTNFEWLPNVDFVDDNTLSGPTVIPQEDITYFLVATSENAYCSDGATVEVEVIPADVDIEEGDYAEICLGESIDLTALTTTAGVGFTWLDDPTLSDPITDTAVIATPTVSTWYFTELIVGGCTVYDSILVRVDSLPLSSIIAVPSDQPYCPGETISLISPTYEPASFPDIMHQWSPGTGTQSDLSNWNLVLSAVETTTYTRVTTNHACSVTETFEVEVVDVSTSVSFSETTICAGESVQLMVLEGNDPEWSPSGGLSCTECPDPIASPESTTTYTVEVNIDGCPISAPVLVNVIDDPVVVSFTDATLCPGDDIQMEVLTGDNPTWSPSEGLSCTDCANPIASPESTTVYTVEAMVNGCLQSNEVNIIIVNPSSLGLPEETSICPGSSGETLNIDPDADDIVWSPTNDLTCDNCPNPVATPAVTTTYTVTATLQDCPVTAQIIVNVVLDPQILLSFADTIICAGDSAVLNLIQGDDPIVWTPNDDLSCNDCPMPTASPGSTTTYTVSATDQGCPTVDQEVTVTVVDAPVITDLVVDPEGDVPFGAPVIVTAETDPDPVDGGTFEWLLNDITQASTTNTLNFNVASVTNVIFATVTNENGCTGSAETNFTGIEPLFEIPNAFTPNGDNTNDFFQVVSSGTIDILSFKIYNRWGQLIYEGSGDSAIWDGSQNGKQATSDVYVYVIELKKAGFDNAEIMTGDITLIR